MKMGQSSSEGSQRPFQITGRLLTRIVQSLALLGWVAAGSPLAQFSSCVLVAVLLAEGLWWLGGRIPWPNEWNRNYARWALVLIPMGPLGIFIVFNGNVRGYCCPVKSPTPTIESSPTSTSPPKITITPSATETITATPTASATVTPTPSVTPTVTPYPSATPVAWIYDRFDDGCLSVYQWTSKSLGIEPVDPTPVVYGNCYRFGKEDKHRHLIETTALKVTDLKNAEGGINSRWPSCEIREVQLEIDLFKFAGKSSSWLGLVVPHPEGGNNKAIGIWISAKRVVGEDTIKVISTRGWIGSQTTATQEVLADDVPLDTPIVLGIRFTGEEAQVLVGNIDAHEAEPIEAIEFPSYFSIVYKSQPGSELTFRISEVRVEPASFTSGCMLPTLTPIP